MKRTVATLPLVARLRDRLDEHRRRMDAQDERIDAHEARISRQLERLDSFQTRLDEWALASARSRVEYISATHQITAFEKRLNDLEARFTDRYETGDDAARAEARDIVELVRAEHARVRARLTYLGAYEERMRRVESAVLTAIKLDEIPEPPAHNVGADVVEARRAGLIAPDATELPPPPPREPLTAVPSRQASSARPAQSTPTQRTA